MTSGGQKPENVSITTRLDFHKRKHGRAVRRTSVRTGATGARGDRSWAQYAQTAAVELFVGTGLASGRLPGSHGRTAPLHGYPTHVCCAVCTTVRFHIAHACLALQGLVVAIDEVKESCVAAGLAALEALAGLVVPTPMMDTARPKLH